MTAGNGRAGSGRSGSAAASSATLTLAPSRTRVRCRSLRTQNPSSRSCARAGEQSSGSVRHHRCAAEWLAFSVTPLRHPRRDGHTSTATP